MLDAYHYDLPEALVAHTPIEPRDSARLMVYRSQVDQVEYCHVADLPSLVPNSLFVVNDTRVMPARLAAVGKDGRPIELLLLVDQGFGPNGQVRSLVNRFTPVGEVLVVNDASFTVLENTEKSMVLRFSGTEPQLQELLYKKGTTPLPPYIHTSASEVERRAQYQTAFAKEAPSVAAPTASLHFTPSLIDRMKNVGVTFTPVTLQVGLGTFAPIFPENFAAGKLHGEYFAIPKESATAIATAKEKHVPVVAVGTTVVRTLESGKIAVMNHQGVIASTDLFIYPPYTFTIPDVLMTNFHVPRSSLMCLVDAFLKHKGARRSILDLYHLAITERFRFYSYGDAMLLL